jgi:hypothetical protein
MRDFPGVILIFIADNNDKDYICLLNKKLPGIQELFTEKLFHFSKSHWNSFS